MRAFDPQATQHTTIGDKKIVQFIVRKLLVSKKKPRFEIAEIRALDRELTVLDEQKGDTAFSIQLRLLARVRRASVLKGTVVTVVTLVHSCADRSPLADAMADH